MLFQKKNAMVRLSNSPWKVYLTSTIILLWIWKYPPRMRALAMQFCSKKKIFWSFKEIVLFSLNNLNSNIHIRCLAFLLTLQPCANILPLKYAIIVTIRPSPVVGENRTLEWGVRPPTEPSPLETNTPCASDRNRCSNRIRCHVSNPPLQKALAAVGLLANLQSFLC